MNNYTVHEILAPYIQGLCSTQRLFEGEHTSFDILPDSIIEFVWNCGVQCSAVCDGQERPLPACYVVGLLKAPLRIVARGLVQVLRVRFYPWGIQPLLGRQLQPTPCDYPTGLLWVDKTLHPDRKAPGDAFNTMRARDNTVTQLQALLLQQALVTSLDDPAIVRVAQTLMTLHGDCSIAMLAQYAGLSERSLRRKFRLSIQTNPKDFARLTRFEYVRDMLWQTPHTSLAEIALAAGYSDQAHMQREFRSFGGSTPSQFAARMHALRELFS